MLAKLVPTQFANTLTIIERLLLVSAFLVLNILLILSPPSVTSANGYAPNWTPPVELLPEGLGLDVGTSLVSDQAGRAHLVWQHNPDDDQEPITYYYAVWQQGEWSAPIDVFVETRDYDLGWPVLVPGIDGWLYMFWNSSRAIFVSRSWASDAQSARAWSPPTQLFSCPTGCGVPMDAVQDTDGTFHIVFTERIGDLLYTQASSWLGPWPDVVTISSVRSGQTAFLPKLSVSVDGKVHTVWSEVPITGLPHQGLMYASTSGRASPWNRPVEIAGEYNTDGNILAVGEDVVYVAWNVGIGGVPGGRYLQRSRDGGKTWEIPIKFSNTSAMQGYPSLGIDSLGRLHALTGGAEYFAFRSDSDNLAVQIPEGDPQVLNIERARMTIVNGNTLVAIWAPNQSGIFSSSQVLSIPALPTRSVPQPELVITPEPASVSNEQVVEERQLISNQYELIVVEKPVSKVRTFLTFLLGPAFVLVFILFVILRCRRGES